MSLHKTLLLVTSKCPKLPQLLAAYKFTRSSLLSTKNFQTFSKEFPVKYSQVFPYHDLFYSFSSAATEEPASKRYLDSAITVPPLQFEDKEFDQPVTHEELCNALQACDSLEEQMHALTSTLALDPEDLERRVNFCKVIESFLKPFFGNIRIQMFGSTVNGFGFKGCDIDMSFETFTKQKEEISYLETPDVPLVSEVLCGKVTPEEISMLPPKEQLLFIHTVLLEFFRESTVAPIFINAHVPLVRFNHDKYNLKCDLTCRNKVAFANSKLLYLFGRLDERVIPFMMTIRYWAKHVELIGKGLNFNTYTISLMVIHFLQTRSPPILPSAEQILALSDSLEIDDMSDRSFLEIKKHIPSSKNTQTLSELLKEFFFFYTYFDFSRVICPLIGGSVPREKFFADAPKKFRMNVICVQDPMMLSHNVAELVEYKVCKKFITELMAGCEIFQDNSNFSSSSSKWGLLTLLDKPDKYITYSNFTKRSFCVPFIRKQIINEEIKDASQLTAETLLYLLNHILLFDCRPLDFTDMKEMLQKHEKAIERQKKVHEYANNFHSDKVLQDINRSRGRKPKKSNLEINFFESNMLEDFEKCNAEHTLIICAECKVVKNTWLGRDFVHVDSLSEISLVEKERYVSLHVAKQNELNTEKDSRQKPTIFFFECYLPRDQSEQSLLINLRPFQSPILSPVLGIFLKEYIPKLLKSINEES